MEYLLHFRLSHVQERLNVKMGACHKSQHKNIPNILADNVIRSDCKGQINWVFFWCVKVAELIPNLIMQLKVGPGMQRTISKHVKMFKNRSG